MGGAHVRDSKPSSFIHIDTALADPADNWSHTLLEILSLHIDTASADPADNWSYTLEILRKYVLRLSF